MKPNQGPARAAAALATIAICFVPMAWMSWFVAAALPGSQPTLRDTGWVLLIGSVLAFLLALVFVAAQRSLDQDHKDDEDRRTW